MWGFAFATGFPCERESYASAAAAGKAAGAGVVPARRGPWKSATGRLLGFDPTGEAGRDLGQEVDFTARVPVNTHLSFLGGYSVFRPGRFAVRTRGPETHHFGYIQTTVRF